MNVPTSSEDSEILKAVIDRSITEITIPSEITVLGNSVFRFCKALVTVTLNEGLQEIGPCAFGACAALTSIVMPSTLKKISSSAFDSCIALKTVTLNEGLEKIENYAFYYSSKISGLNIPASVQTIGDYALNEVKEVTMKGTTPPTIGNKTFNSTAKIRIPASALEAYSNATNWSGLVDYFETY